MRIHADVDYADVDGDYGIVEGLCVTCTRCGHEVEVGGTGEASALRGACMLRDERPRGESNFYLVDWE